MTVYRNTVDGMVFLTDTRPGPLTATISREGYTVADLPVDSNPAGTEGLYDHDLTIPFEATRYDGTLVIEWHDDEGIVEVTHDEVVTPILPINEILDILADNGANTQDAMKAEVMVRNIIQAYTGQYFGYRYSTERAKGQGREALTLPARLDELETMSDGRTAFTDGLQIDGDGWFLGRDRHYLNIKEAPPEIWTANPIYDPFTDTHFADRKSYLVTGYWGYRNVPEAVREAARILVAAFACNEIAYYDNYLENIQSADWRMGFYEMRYAGTGNARADLLLAPYRLTHMAVV